MTKKGTDDSDRTLRHNPFASLAQRQEQLGKGAVPPSANAGRATSVVRAREPDRPRAVRARVESRGRSGKVVTRITGLPGANLAAIAAKLRSGLGCSASVEGEDVLLDGSLAERVSQWLERAGDLRDIQEAPARRPAAPAPEAEPMLVREEEFGSSGSGTKRADIRRGARVAIVLKADQATGKLTEGIVREILTSSPNHPRGIKVRLETGEVGRVKIVRP